MTETKKQIAFQKILSYVLLGSIMSAQLSFSKVFYNTSLLDWFISVAIVLTSGWLAHKYWRPGLLARQVSLLLFWSIAIFLEHIEYALQALSESTYVMSYVILALSSAFASIRDNEGPHGAESVQHILTATISVALGASLIHLFGMRYWIALLVLLMICLNAWQLLAQDQRQVMVYISVLGVIPVLVWIIMDPVLIYPSQKKYHDKVVLAKTTPFQQIDVTSWKGEYWFYYNNVNQFSSIDEWLYYEPMVHPAMHLAEKPEKVLIIGGENGIIVRELLKYNDVTAIDLLPLDTALVNLAASNLLFTNINEHSLMSSRVNIIHRNAFSHLHHSREKYDVILVDVPDPLDLELNQYYTWEFYALCQGAISSEGVLVTQAGSPYFATKAYYCINKTLESAAFSTVPIHNQVLSLGEWGWIIADKKRSKEQLVREAKALSFDDVPTKWLNTEAMHMMMSFGKSNVHTQGSDVNTLKQPVVHKFYTKGTWKF